MRKIEDTIIFIKKLNKLFPGKTRISMGVQSLDDNLLRLANRNYDFETIQEVLKTFPDVGLNLDFISFGLEEFWDKEYFDKFEAFVNKFKEKVDSYSVYTLELYPGSIFADARKLAQKV
jgi:coproporphyrinogen III oxidase-like Fe-S oxidoreductase